MFDRPIKNTVSAGGGAKGGGGIGGVARGEKKGVPPKGTKFEKKVEYQNPETFAGVEVSCGN